MANRRMFSKKLINSGRFLRMPVSARLLYYELGMAADDDGIVEAFKVIRAVGVSEDDLNILVTKGFVTILDQEDLIVHIVDWNAHNTMRYSRLESRQPAQAEDEKGHSVAYRKLAVQRAESGRLAKTFSLLFLRSLFSRTE